MNIFLGALLMFVVAYATAHHILLSSDDWVEFLFGFFIGVSAFILIRLLVVAGKNTLTNRSKSS